MRYELIPGVGVNKLHFGMSREEMQQVDGKPKRLITYGTNTPIVKERRQNLDCAYLFDRAVEFMFFEDVPGTFKGILVYKNINFFQDENVIWKLADHDTPEMVCNDRYVMYPNLGILIGGFGKIPIFEGKNVILFAPERKNFWYSFMMENPYLKLEKAKEAKAKAEAEAQAKAEGQKAED
ncbi:MAG: hypothetical protein ACOX7F_07965 [Eubacteriales bacterium]|jgi:hypothetical protein